MHFCSEPGDAGQAIIYGILSFTANECGVLKLINLVLEICNWRQLA
jgi:hypothetical protein